ncbi:outer membrane porin GjpA [Mycolicibacterium porcinum]|uniref:outer membrane porin GjpA n=1 Tax=Mycolicibacterium porcinum TaxID=39693 RepID=UPI003D9BBB9C
MPGWAGDTTTALSSLLGVPAGMVDAFLNGANLNLDALAPMINDAGLIKDTVSIEGINIAFGGLLTPGSTDRSTYEYTDEDGNKVTIPSVGGSIFNSIGMDIKLGALPISLKGEAVGPIGALQGLSQTVGVLLGSGWDDWDGKGNAPAPKPPLFGLKPLAVGDIFSDTAESAGVTKLRDMLKAATVNDIVKKLQGIGTETTADKAVADTTADVAASDTTASDKAAAATELTHTTANKMVAVTVPAADAAAATEDVAKTAAVDATENAGTTTPSKLDVLPKAPSTRPDSSFGTSQRKVAQGIRDAVKNVRNGLGGSSSRASDDSSGSTSGATDSSAGSSRSSAASSDKGSSNSSAKAKVKAKPKTTKDKNKD